MSTLSLPTLLLLAACTGSDPERRLVQAPAGDGADEGDPDDADGGADGGGGSGGDGGDDGGEDTGGDTGDAPGDPGPACATLGPVRARCSLVGAVHWAEGELEAVEVADSIRLAPTGLVGGTDSTGVYNGGSFFYGSWTSPVLEPGIGFDGIVPSWNATTPAGTWISVQVQARVGEAWTAWYRLGVWASGETDLVRHSFEDERDALGRVWTDTVLLDDLADAARIRVTLFTTTEGGPSPELRRLALAFADTGADVGGDAGGMAWGLDLEVPARSQMVFSAGEAWCSPTSTSMVLAYWSALTGEGALDVSVPEAADGTWDEVYEGNGNWPFNVAYAASLGLDGEVGWLGSLADIEPFIQDGVPVVISGAWDPGDIDGAAISSTDGHLLVVRGFTEDGDVEVNDPAASSDAGVPRVYRREQIEAAWLGGSGGIVYLLWEGEDPRADER